MNKRLHEIIRNLSEVLGESGLKVSDECLFEQSCTFLRGEIANENRFPIKASQVGNTDSSGKKESDSTNESVKPTDKQLAFLKKNGVKISPKLTKEEAKIMISNYLQNLDRKNV